MKKLNHSVVLQHQLARTASEDAKVGNNECVSVEDAIITTTQSEDGEFVEVITKRQMKKNKKKKAASKSSDDANSGKSTPSPNHVLTSVNSSPRSDGTASLSEGERAISKLVSAGELSFVHPDVKHHPCCQNPAPKTIQAAQVQFLGEPLPQSLKHEKPWMPSHLQFLDDASPQEDDLWAPKVEHQIQCDPESHAVPEEEAWAPKVLQFLDDPLPDPVSPEEQVQKPKVERSSSEKTCKPKVAEMIASWAPKAQLNLPAREQCHVTTRTESSSHLSPSNAKTTLASNTSPAIAQKLTINVDPDSSQSIKEELAYDDTSTHGARPNSFQKGLNRCVLDTPSELSSLCSPKESAKQMCNRQFPMHK